MSESDKQLLELTECDEAMASDPALATYDELERMGMSLSATGKGDTERCDKTCGTCVG